MQKRKQAQPSHKWKWNSVKKKTFEDMEKVSMYSYWVTVGGEIYTYNLALHNN